MSVVASAQNAPKLDNGQMDQLLAPVALYPDAVLSQFFMAATYPDDVKAASDWSKRNGNQSGDAAVKAVDGEPWDPSVKSLVAFPSVMDLAGRQPDWVVQVGNAFLDQPDDVMDSVQRLRRQAQANGSLKSNEQQTVTVQQQGPAQVIEIAPTNPQVVYVPQYNPTVVYGAWPYPAYPPYYYPPPVGSVFATSLVAGIGFGLGVAAIDSMWGGFNWGRNDVNINVNRYNNINVHNRLNANQTNFQHNAARRGSTPYNNAANRQRFDSQRQAGLANRGGNAGRANVGGGRGGAAPGSRDAARDRAAQSMHSRTGESIAGHPAGGARAGGAGGAGGARERVGQGGGGAAAHQNAAARQRQDHSAAMDRSRASNHDSAFRDAGNGSRARQQAQRGNVQHANFGGGGGGGARAAGGAGARAGAGAGGAHMGGGRAGGGGGGHMGGGGRRR